ncbi:PREDICTED: CD70 antigen-like [Elephantulus edwardii]|uniref:CD70 antigen-like n=1 Tax=Elephantulus edwardii TaxID=28737 RepID=UPI0003F06419|nr:PREDICTED: CD70 antigen-like [Elephantulus edwardii]
MESEVGSCSGASDARRSGRGIPAQEAYCGKGALRGRDDWRLVFPQEDDSEAAGGFTGPRGGFQGPLARRPGLSGGTAVARGTKLPAHTRAHAHTRSPATSRKPGSSFEGPPIAAELQLNHTGLQQDPRLRWQAGPALGRSFLHGLELNNGQLRVLQDGIYRLHIQVTLANCSSPQRTRSQQATLAISVCGPATHQTTLLRLSFYSDCTVASQRLTRLAAGDTLCTDLTGPLQASPNTDETFFGIERVHP